MSEQSVQIVALLRRRLQQTLRRITLAELAAGALVAVAGISLLWLACIAVEAGLWLATPARTALLWALVAASAGLILYYVALPALRHLGVFRPLSERAVARRIGRRYTDIDDRLVNLLELAEGRRSHAPDAFVDQAIRMLGRAIEPVRFEDIERFERPRRLSRFASAPAAGILLFFALAPRPFADALHRLVSPGAYFAPPGPFQLVVEPGDMEVVSGDSAALVVRVVGEQRPRVVTVALNTVGEKEAREVTLHADSAGAFRYSVPAVRQDLRYRAAAGPVETDWFDVVVIQRPVLRGLDATLEPPRYTGLPAVRQESNNGHISALPGSTVRLEVGFGGENVEAAFVRFDDGTEAPLAIEGNQARGAFTVRKPGAYQVYLRNAHGIANAEPVRYAIGLQTDAAPTIALLEPEPAADLTETLTARLRARINDDYGFSKAALFYRLAESEYGAPSDVFTGFTLGPLDPRRLDQELGFAWDIGKTTPLDPVPGDVIEYFVQVWDNDAVGGFKSAKSPVYRLTLPSLAEQYERLSEEQSAAEDLVEDLLRDAQGVKEDFDALKQDLRSKQEGNWENERRLQQLQEKQQAMENQVEALSEKMERMAEAMRENNLVSPETLEAFQELQRVVEEISSPELKEALRQLQEAMQQLDLPKLQQSMEQFEFNEQQYQQRLERTLELLKKARLQQDLDAAARQIEELARQEKRMAEETGKLLGEEPPQGAPEPQNAAPRPGDEPPGAAQRPTAEELAREQERAREAFEALMKEMEEVRRQSEEMRSGPKNQMQQLQQQMERRQMPQQMQQNADQLKQNQLEKAQQGQQSMEQQLRQMQQAVEQAKQQMQQKSKQMNKDGLRRALDNVLTLSQQQEALRRQVEALAADAPQLRPHAQRQVELAQDLRVVSDTLQRLAREMPEMNREVQRYAGEAGREMEAATTALAERLTAQAEGNQKAAMMHLNELALLLSDLLNQMMNGQSGEGASMEEMMQQLQQMAGQQQQLNEQIQQMLNDMQGNRLTTDMQARMQQLSQQQEAIRRQLKQLGRDPAARGKLMGDLNKIAEQMEETIEELQRQNADRRTVERQQQILTRLLEAQRAMQERGEDQKRQSRTGGAVNRQSPGALPPAERAEKLRRDLLKALESGYSQDYQELIKRYFELLQQQAPAQP